MTIHRSPSTRRGPSDLSQRFVGNIGRGCRGSHPRFVPDERAWVLVPGRGPVAQVVFERDDALVRAAFQESAGEFREPAFHEVQRGVARRREVQDETWVAKQPAVDLGSLVCRGVIEHDMDVELGGNGLVDRDEELLELERMPAPPRIVGLRRLEDLRPLVLRRLDRRAVTPGSQTTKQSLAKLRVGRTRRLELRRSL